MSATILVTFVPPLPVTLRCHRCGEVFFEEQGPIANRWVPRSLAMCFSCLDVFHRERWERGA